MFQYKYPSKDDPGAFWGFQIGIGRKVADHFDVLKEGLPVLEREIVDLCKTNLARFKKPRYVAFVDQIPKNASGKTLKRELKKRYSKGPLPPKVQ